MNWQLTESELTLFSQIEENAQQLELMHFLLTLDNAPQTSKACWQEVNECYALARHAEIIQIENQKKVLNALHLFPPLLKHDVPMNYLYAKSMEGVRAEALLDWAKKQQIKSLDWLKHQGVSRYVM